MTLFLLSTRLTWKRALAGVAVFGLSFASLPVWPDQDAFAAPATVLRQITACPDPEALAASAQVAEQVWRDRLSYESLCLYMASSALAASDAAKATDLYVLARVRSRYDLARCETWPHGSASSATAALRMGAEQALNAAGVKTILPQMIAVARLDTTYDYVSDDLEQMCDGGPLKPTDAWKAERRSMQAAADAASTPPVP